jgi:hypothetical protein
MYVRRSIRTSHIFNSRDGRYYVCADKWMALGSRVAASQKCSCTLMPPAERSTERMHNSKAQSCKLRSRVKQFKQNRKTISSCLFPFVRNAGLTDIHEHPHPCVTSSPASPRAHVPDLHTGTPGYNDQNELELPSYRLVKSSGHVYRILCRYTCKR